MKRIIFASMLGIIALLPLMSQEKQKALTLSGYLTSMQSVMFDSLSGPFMNENLLHNRLNFKGYLDEHITIAAEFRNRLFTGDFVRAGSSYAEMTGNDAGLFDMSWNIVNQPSFFLNTTIDRLWIDFNYGKIQVRAGRQRINWGQALVWNPNDIFNTYSFFDFDYVERPGSDAVRFQLYPTSTSSAELVVKLDNEKDITAAGLYRFTASGYDFQILGGYMNSEDLVLGAGWSGSAGSLSFRGEGSVFRNAEQFSSSKTEVLLTAGTDKIFENNSMAQLQIMYANTPLKIASFTSFYSADLSPKNLAFSRFSAFGQYTCAATPLLNIGLSAMWFPDLKGYFAGPSIDYSLSENLDFSIIWQHFRSIISDSQTRINLAFLRIKYSF